LIRVKRWLRQKFFHKKTTPDKAVQANAIPNPTFDDTDHTELPMDLTHAMGGAKPKFSTPAFTPGLTGVEPTMPSTILTPILENTTLKKSRTVVRKVGRGRAKTFETPTGFESLGRGRGKGTDMDSTRVGKTELKVENIARQNSETPAHTSNTTVDDNVLILGNSGAQQQTGSRDISQAPSSDNRYTRQQVDAQAAPHPYIQATQQQTQQIQQTPHTMPVQYAGTQPMGGQYTPTQNVPVTGYHAPLQANYANYYPHTPQPSTQYAMYPPQYMVPQQFLVHQQHPPQQPTPHYYQLSLISVHKDWLAHPNYPCLKSHAQRIVSLR
jgi:hypothetical protein